jgi:membrane associated rhomboid family serine protease
MSITILIIAITVGASFFAWSRHDIFEKWMMIPYRVKHYKEFYRFLTSGFIHSGYLHLGFNMFAFWSFGKAIEYYFMGPIFLLVLYIGGIIISDIPTYLKFQNYQNYRSLGASGGVSSVIFSTILLSPLSQIRIFLIPMSGFIFGILYLIYSYYQSKNSSDNINHDAHFYGALFGIGLTILVRPDSVQDFFYQISTWHISGF